MTKRVNNIVNYHNFKKSLEIKLIKFCFEVTTSYITTSYLCKMLCKMQFQNEPVKCRKYLHFDLDENTKIKLTLSVD